MALDVGSFIGDLAGKFMTDKVMSLPGINTGVAQGQLDAISTAMYESARRFMKVDIARSSQLAIRSASRNLHYAATMMSYQPDVKWRKAGASTSAHFKAGLQTLSIMHGSSKYTTEDTKYAGKTAVSAVTRLMSNYLMTAHAQEDTMRRELMQQGLAMLVNDAEVFYGFRGLADHIPQQAMADLASGADRYYKTQLHDLEMYRMWKDYNQFDAKSEFMGYFGSGTTGKGSLPSTGGDSLPTRSTSQMPNIPGLIRM